MPLTETDITLVCVSNEVGGTYAGNARWLGVPLAALLRRAGVQAGADQVLSAATDGMTISTPLATIMDGRNALLAVGHERPAAARRARLPGPDGGPRPVRLRVRDQVGHPADRDHVRAPAGLLDPARLRGPGADQDRVADRRAQAARPGQGGPGDGGRGRLGAATGIAAVEVSVDDGPWHPARLAAADGIDTWRQWMWTWDAAPGLHTLRVRATDNTGATQPSRRAQPVPNGASGWDSVVVTVT